MAVPRADVTTPATGNSGNENTPRAKGVRVAASTTPKTIFIPVNFNRQTVVVIP